MRSRDGNFSFSFTISTIRLLLLLVLSSALFADEYLISYRYTVKNSSLYNETLYVSKAMKPCQLKAYRRGLTLDRKSSDTLKDTLLKNSDTFLEYISKLGLDIKSSDQVYNQQDNSFTSLTLKTTCFKVDFNEKFVKITPLK